MIREQWRVVLLVILLLGSTFALFAPQGTIGSDGGNASEGNTFTEESDGPTNLKFGLELAGGTRIRAPVTGLTAEDAQLPNGTSGADAQRQLAADLGVEQSDVMIRRSANGSTVEVFTENVTQQQFRSALDGANVGYDTVRQGVTDQTRNDIVRTLRDKISEAGLSGGRVTEQQTAAGQNFVVVEMPNANQSEMEELVTSRGQVTVVAHYPTENGTYQNDTVLERGDFASIGSAQQDQASASDQAYVDVVLTQEAAGPFAEAMREKGYTSPEGVGNCQYPQEKEDPGYCLYTVVDGEIVYGAAMGDLAQTIRSGEFQEQPSFRLMTNNMSEARRLQINLHAGSLPATLDMERGTTTYLQPSLAEEFKVYSLVAGLAAVVAVSGTVFVRYGDPKVALPMLVTALSEVVILLGFAAAIQLPLDLSHIAGLIAVIGTGVDDLIIIADEVMSEGDVHSSRVFQSRFRKAFWVIGAAAATTIIAMSPLAVLSLGELQGFALITILGVLIGVLITRPAYGDILRHLLTDR